MPDRVWNVRLVSDESKNWFVCAAAYVKVTRGDGMPVWELDGDLSARYPKGKGRVADVERAGEKSGLPRNTRARTGGIALELSDVIPPEDETRWRLGGVKFKLLYAFASKQRAGKATKSRRLTAGLAIRDLPGGQWKFYKRIGTVTEKQLKDVHAVFGFEHDMIASMPRKAGVLMSEVMHP